MGNLINTWAGQLSLVCFLLAYILVIFEEKIHMRKSKPVVLVGCIMWGIIGIYEAQHGGGHAHDHVKELIAEMRKTRAGAYSTPASFKYKKTP